MYDMRPRDRSLRDIPPGSRRRQKSQAYASVSPRRESSAGFLKTSSDGPVDIALLLWPSFDMHDLSALLDIFELANSLHQHALFTWRVLGLDAATVEASSGVSVQADDVFSDTLHAENILILAGFEHQASAASADFSSWLCRQLELGTRIGLIGGASNLLAQMGLLDGCRCAAHWAHIDGYRRQHHQVDFRDQIYHVDRQILSCSGGCGTTDLALALVRELSSSEVTLTIADRLNRSLVRDEHDVQQLPTSAVNSLTRSAVHIMRQHIETPLNSREIAARLGTSLRRLQRCFKHDEKLTPTQFYVRERLLQARRLLWQDPSLSIASVAHRCGFVSGSDFARNFTRQFGYPPSRLY
ncbi:MAG TPA: helix-turn-helix domain-containing protein [Dongiaceae bacterium]|nr:helix-turn-helix domain-containing protein [Dongiaceae bacterium]